MTAIIPQAREVELRQAWNEHERHDDNDIPPECTFPRAPRPMEELFREDTGGDFESELHRLTIEGSVRFRVNA